MNKALATIVGAAAYGGSALMKRVRGWTKGAEAPPQARSSRKKSNPFARKRRKQKKARS
ncbi:MAG TPA: hypothetical protein VMU08_13220 [Rhizomicrobium sp.]|nr:hypothetical protein [Rhizomicrobium sp.]